MSRDIVVLTPNGRRVKVHCKADTSIIQLLEDVCSKQELQPSDYNLKHHNHILDLTTTVRFCNLPNKALLELVEAEKKRVESNVTIGLTLNDGERVTGDFSPNTCLYDLIMTLAPNNLSSLQNPTIIYMRQEVTGINALKEKCLRHLGLIMGRAILRLLDKTNAIQANVSSVYRRIQPEKVENNPKTKVTPDENHVPNNSEPCIPGPSGVQQEKTLQSNFDPVKIIQKEKEQKSKINIDPTSATEHLPNVVENVRETVKQDEIYTFRTKETITQESLERRLRIEEEVTFIGSQKAIAFMQPDGNEDELSDLPDDFYELTIEEVRKMYHELQQRRVEIENTPLLTTAKRGELDQTSLSKLKNYKNVVVRIQFPDSIILQGVFTPSNTLEDIQNFVKEHLNDQNKPFHIFTTPLKETLDPKITLLEARFVPCVHMHFKWLEESPFQTYLKEEIYLKKTTSDAASILASKYRAPNRRKLEESSDSSQKSNIGSSTSKQSKLPKWFKK